jgi:hypothetical protein
VLPVLIQARENFAITQAKNFVAYHNDYIAIRQIFLLLTKALSQQALDPVAVDRVFKLFLGDRESQSWLRRRLPADEQGDTVIA